MAIPVIFPGCTAATGADFLCGSVLAVNSFDCVIYNATEKCKTCTSRPYSFISTSGNCILALGNDCSNKLFVLNSCFEEIGSICTDTGDGPLLTVYSAGCGRLILTYRRSIVAVDADGSSACIFATLNGAEKDFIAATPTCGGILLAYNDGSRDNIQYRRCDGAVSTCTLPQGISVKSFATGEDGTVFGLFAKGYPYRYLAPILVDGVLVCNFEGCFLSPLCDCI